MLLKHNSNKFEDITFATFDVATFDEVEDVNFPRERLIHANEDEDFEYHGSKKYLLHWLEDFYHKEIIELDALYLTTDMPSLEFIEFIDHGAFGEVYKLKWLGLLCATKKIDVVFFSLFIKEVNILASISHSNLITYYFALKNNANRSIESSTTKCKNEYLYIGMELMENNLSNLLEEKKTIIY